MSRVSISAKHARDLLRWIDASAVRRQFWPAVDALRVAATAKPKSSKVRATEKKCRAKTKSTKEVRALVMERAGHKCEVCGGTQMLTMDHFWGKAREESVESCWALCWPDHERRQNGNPSRYFWLGIFRRHAATHGYSSQAEKAGKEMRSIRELDQAAQLSRGAP